MLCNIHQKDIQGMVSTKFLIEEQLRNIAFANAFAFTKGVVTVRDFLLEDQLGYWDQEHQ